MRKRRDTFYVCEDRDERATIQEQRRVYVRLRDEQQKFTANMQRRRRYLGEDRAFLANILNNFRAAGNIVAVALVEGFLSALHFPGCETLNSQLSYRMPTYSCELDYHAYETLRFAIRKAHYPTVDFTLLATSLYDAFPRLGPCWELCSALRSLSIILNHTFRFRSYSAELMLGKLLKSARHLESLSIEYLDPLARLEHRWPLSEVCKFFPRSTDLLILALRHLTFTYEQLTELIRERCPRLRSVTLASVEITRP